MKKSTMIVMLVLLITGAIMIGCVNQSKAAENVESEISLVENVIEESQLDESQPEVAEPQDDKNITQPLTTSVDFYSLEELYEYIGDNSDIYDELVVKAFNSGYDHPQIFIPVPPDNVKFDSVYQVGENINFIYRYIETGETIAYSWKYASTGNAENRLSNAIERQSLQEVESAPGYYVSDVPEATDHVSVYWLSEDKNHMFICYLPRHKYREYFNLDSALTTYSIASSPFSMEPVIINANDDFTAEDESNIVACRFGYSFYTIEEFHSFVNSDENYREKFSNLLSHYFLPMSIDGFSIERIDLDSMHVTYVYEHEKEDTALVFGWTCDSNGEQQLKSYITQQDFEPIANFPGYYMGGDLDELYVTVCWVHMNQFFRCTLPTEMYRAFFVDSSTGLIMEAFPFV